MMVMARTVRRRGAAVKRPIAVLLNNHQKR